MPRSSSRGWGLTWPRCRDVVFGGSENQSSIELDMDIIHDLINHHNLTVEFQILSRDIEIC